jgi:hypothetical protein
MPIGRIAVKKLSAGIVIGSQSDWDMMQHAARRLKDFGDGGQGGRRGAAFRAVDGKR